MVVIPGTPHPFWLFHPWFDSTVQYVDDFLKRTMPATKRQRRGLNSRGRQAVVKMSS
jgi:hypothetical protein